LFAASETPYENLSAIGIVDRQTWGLVVVRRTSAHVPVPVSTSAPERLGHRFGIDLS